MSPTYNRTNNEGILIHHFENMLKTPLCYIRSITIGLFVGL
jgi:hypothetical protein